MDLLWLPFSLATIFFYGLGQVFAKETRTNVPSANLLLILGMNMLVIWSAYWIILREPGSYGLDAWLQGAAGAALSGFAYVAFYESIKRGKVSIVGTIVGAYAPWTVVLAIVFLGESMSLTDGIGVTMVVTSMLMFTYAVGDNGGKKTERLGIVMAIAAMFLFGTSAAVAKGAITEIGNTNFIGLYALIVPAIWVVYWLVTSKGHFEMPKSNRRILELSLLFLAMGGITYYLAIENGNVSIVSPVTNVYPIVTIAVANVRLKEKLTTRQIVALVLMFASIPLFSI
jgi:transporter family protein